jgi:thiamine-phosphate pyrophosphorylase
VTSIADRHLYLCTPDRPDLASFVSACIAGGVDIVQLRDKHLEARPLLERAALVRAVCADAGVPFILNDRPDLALEAGADGVHVGQDDAPVVLARRILGPDAIIGLSTHGPADLAGAVAIGAGPRGLSYISAGPVEPTPTKPGRPGTGLAYLQQATAAAEGAGIPVFVTGGVTPEKIPLLAKAGARHFVVVRYLTEAADPQLAARALREAVDTALGGGVEGGVGGGVEGGVGGGVEGGV